ncbi:hypothetical protein LCGC14_0832580 [marine sediment metagenome]|uniref:Uncharacterized protein n=1 Tax=marine sediment metagenome TaxID=412755 RepID=A0A0F9PK78_9ZZZZ
MTELLAGYVVTVAIAFALVMRWFLRALVEGVKNGHLEGVPTNALENAAERHVLYAAAAILALLVASTWPHLLATFCLVRATFFVLHRIDHHEDLPQ